MKTNPEERQTIVRDDQLRAALIEAWPSAIVARREVSKFSGRLVASGTLANADCRGDGPEGRVNLNGQVAYTKESLIEWLLRRSRRVRRGGKAAA